MRYVALLRGINVGQTKRIEMKRLKALFESLGYANVSTYINSGNVFFESTKSSSTIRNEVETVYKRELGIEIPTLVYSMKEMIRIANAIPNEWQNNTEQKSDIAYLFDSIDSKSVIDKLPMNREFMDIRYVKGALLWNVARADIARSQLDKLSRHKLYQQMTVRNVNTARYLAEI